MGVYDMKSQDFLVLIKLISLQKEELRKIHYPLLKQSHFETNDNYSIYSDISLSELYTLRGLGHSLGISKTEISASLRRSIENNLIIFNDLQSGEIISLSEMKWQVNKKALFELVKYAIPYFYPAKHIGLNFGLATGFSSPILENELTSAGTLPYVWPSEYGTSYGQAVEPIYKTVPYASKYDDFVYNCFALIDAYRLGKAREKDIAIKYIEKELLG